MKFDFSRDIGLAATDANLNSEIRFGSSGEIQIAIGVKDVKMQMNAGSNGPYKESIGGWEVVLVVVPKMSEHDVDLLAEATSNAPQSKVEIGTFEDKSNLLLPEFVVGDCAFHIIPTRNWLVDDESLKQLKRFIGSLKKISTPATQRKDLSTVFRSKIR